MNIIKDEQGAKAIYDAYVLKQQRLQLITNQLTGEFKRYFIMPDEQLQNFITDYSRFEQWFFDRISEEIHHFRFAFEQEAADKELKPHVRKMEQLHSQVLGMFDLAVPRFAVSIGDYISVLDPAKFSVRKAQVCLPAELKKELESLFTLKLDENPKREKAAQLAYSINNQVKELAGLLPQGIPLFSTPTLTGANGQVLPGRQGLFDVSRDFLVNDKLLSAIK